MSAMQGFPECDAMSIGGPCAPLMPSISQVERSGTSINLQWQANSSYDYFLFGKSVNGSWEADQSVVYLSTSVSVQRGNSYAFRLAACSYMHGCGSYTHTNTIQVPLLTAPAITSVSNSGLTLTANWGSSAEATRYEVQARTNGSWGSIINRGTTRNYSLAGIRGSRYAFRVRACDSSGCSPFSSISSEVVILTLATPQAPTISNSVFTVTANWTSISGAARYDVQVRTNSGTWSGTINKNVDLNHSVTGVRGNSYSFRVRACDSFGCTGYSAASSAFGIPSLATPSRPSVTNSNLSLTATWGTVTGANNYDVQVSTNGSWGTAISKGVTTNHTNLGTRGRTYAYRVRACDGFGCTNYSSASTALAIPSLAVAPRPTVSASGFDLTASWGAIAGASQYEVQVSTNGTWATAVSTGLTPIFEITGVRGSTYIFRVSACDGFGCTSYSTASIAFSVPTLAVAPKPTVVSSGLSLTTSWGPVSGASKYEIQVSTNGVWSAAVNKGTTRTHTITGVRGNIYAYRVRACDSFDCTNYSTVSTAINLPTLGAAPRPAVSSSGLELTASWGAVSGASEYEIQVSTNGTWGEPINTGATPTYKISGVRGSTYAYRVRACDSFGCSNYSTVSNVQSVPTLAVAPKPTVTSSDLALTASWGPVAGANYYDIQVSTNGTWAQAINTGITRTHTITAARGSAYAFRVRACDSFGCSNYSTVSNALSVPTLAVPSTPTVVVSGLSLTASWGVVSGASRYEIQVGTNGTWADPINTGTTRSHSITGARGSTYTYRVMACDSYGCTAYSPVSNGVTPPDLAGPAALTIISSELNVELSWGAVVDAERYEIQIHSGGSWGSVINRSANRNYAFEGAVGTSYKFRVRACDTPTCSAFSESGTITISQLSPPTVASEDTSGGGARLVSLSSGTNGAVIRYTLDDSPVTAASAVYTHPLMIRTGIIRAKAYHEDWVASDERRVVLSLSGDPDSTVIFIHVDILGSVIGETDSEGKLIRVKEYKPFGERKEEQ
ncbi:chitobiase/beta-hexosaminidase C-terminal domain-containing protein [Idiomarina sp. A28L]|uniref:chitobiase/beta-hexosaminidase C-terminal domain-containing protein n=1 Tax=Idiomarina sp. A28L TaxID=1036674 RepID=UPI000305D193|nr:chitobiase/beta-hexosaminidase C-terminal domain-containing protein [Idiomarina sp. A28L]